MPHRAIGRECQSGSVQDLEGLEAEPFVFKRDWVRFIDKQVDFMEGEYLPGGVSLPISIYMFIIIYTWAHSFKIAKSYYNRSFSY